MNQLYLENVSKSIKGTKLIDSVSLKLTGGQIYGFVGANGSGKTMLFRAIAGLIRIDSGKVVYNDQVIGKDLQILPSVGLTIENANLYPEWNAFDNLKFLADIKHRITKQEIRDAIQLVGLDPMDKRPIRKYSLGMRQRLVIAQAIMEKPDVLILDEPFNALDQDGVDWLRKLLQKKREEGCLILLSSHNGEDIDLLADEIYMVRAGRVTVKEHED